MKKKLFRKVSRSNIAIFFYYVQLAILAPLLFPMAGISVIADFILKRWSAYKDWYLSKTLRY